MLESIEGALDDWGNEKSGTSAELEDTRLESLLQVGLVLKEAEMAGAATGKGGTGSAGPLAGSGDDTFQFDAVPVPGAPPSAEPAHAATTAPQKAGRHYVMTLQKTDVGVGQTTAGTSRRSPEIPLVSRGGEFGTEGRRWICRCGMRFEHSLSFRRAHLSKLRRRLDSK